MNFVFVSPNFPATYWNFCDRLKRCGATVLGIGDCASEALAPELRASLDDYYRVDSFANYDQVYRGVAHFASRHGRIDWIESNNECWLETDARLRTDFNVTTGEQTSGIARYKSKYDMKAYYARAGVPAPKCHRIAAETTIDEARWYIGEDGGYPFFAKPEVGVGAAGTFKLGDEADLRRFFAEKPDVPYALEQFVTGDIYSYDAIVDSHGEPLFESSCWFPPSMAEVVERQLDITYRVLPEVPPQLRERGRATVRAFGVRSRYVHLEFFRLAAWHGGLGDQGDFVGLEVNMRPAGGYTPDLMNIAHGVDVYRIWADMVCHDRREVPDAGDHQYCVWAGRRDSHSYAHSHDEVMARHGERIRMQGRMPDALSDDLGQQFYVAREPDEAAADAFASFVLERA
jgi:hypothetical protein